MRGASRVRIRYLELFCVCVFHVRSFSSLFLIVRFPLAWLFNCISLLVKLSFYHMVCCVMLVVLCYVMFVVFDMLCCV